MLGHTVVRAYTTAPAGRFGNAVSLYIYALTSKIYVQTAAFVLKSYTWWAGVAQSVQRLSTGWTARGSNPGVGEIFRIRPDRPWGPPILLYNDYRVSYPWEIRQGRGVDHPRI